MEQPLSQTFPLWIQPWISGIYAFHYPDRCADVEAFDGNIPAILTAYIDEVGEATLMMHVLDYTEMTGGDIEWCHWAAVRWRGGDRISLFGREDEGWDLYPKMDVPLSIEEMDDLLVAKEMNGFSKTIEASRSMAEALLPHMPFVHWLSVWDRESPLDFSVIDEEDIQDHPSLLFVRDREVVPLINTSYLRARFFEREIYKSDIWDFPRHPDHNFTVDILRRKK
jgi:hypothetical protein